MPIQATGGGWRGVPRNCSSRRPRGLGLLLTTVGGRQVLSTVETVIVDEIRSLVENRRGGQLMLGLGHLVELAGEFQGVAMPAGRGAWRFTCASRKRRAPPPTTG